MSVPLTPAGEDSMSLEIVHSLCTLYSVQLNILFVSMMPFTRVNMPYCNHAALVGDNYKRGWEKGGGHYMDHFRLVLVLLVY